MVGIDVGLGAEGLVWRDLSAMTELVVGQRYETPEEFVEDSLGVFLNQGVLDRTSKNGFNVLSPTVFELKEAITGLGTDHMFFVMYVKA